MLNLNLNKKLACRYLISFFKTIVLTLSVFSLFFSVIFFDSRLKTTVLANSRSSEITRELREINSSVEDLSKKKDTLQEEIDRINNQIERTEEIIRESEEIIKELELEIVINQEEIYQLTNDTKQILKEIQISGNADPILQILTAKNLSEVLNQIYLFSSRHDQLRENSLSLQTANQQKQAILSSQQEIISESEMTKQVLLLNKQEKDSLLLEYKGNEKKYATRIQKLRSEQAELERLAREAEEERQRQAKVVRNTTNNNSVGGSSSGSTGGSVAPNPDKGSGFIPNPGTAGCVFEDSRDPGISGFINPVPSATIFRGNDFGCPTVSGRFHDGIDLHAPAGTPIGATASGVVANKGSGNVVGYGHWIMLRHTMSSGERVYSLYAHMLGPSSLNIGDSVSQGQTIGRVGCSGLCWGNHVHFMLYSSSYERFGMGCNHGSSRCFNPARWISF